MGVTVTVAPGGMVSQSRPPYPMCQFQGGAKGAYIYWANKDVGQNSSGPSSKLAGQLIEM